MICQGEPSMRALLGSERDTMKCIVCATTNDEDHIDADVAVQGVAEQVTQTSNNNQMLWLSNRFDSQCPP